MKHMWPVSFFGLFVFCSFRENPKISSNLAHKKRALKFSPIKRRMLFKVHVTRQFV